MSDMASTRGASAGPSSGASGQALRAAARRNAAVLVPGISTVLTGAVSLTVVVPSLVFSLLVLLAAVQAVNSMVRRRLKHHEIPTLPPTLRIELWVGVGAPLGIGAVGLLLDPPAGAVIALGVATLIDGLALAMVEISIAKRVAGDPSKISVSTRIGNSTWLHRRLELGSPARSIDAMLGDFEEHRFGFPLRWLIGAIWGTTMSGARWLMVIVVLGAGVSLVATGVQAAVADGEPRASSTTAFVPGTLGPSEDGSGQGDGEAASVTTHGTPSSALPVERSDASDVCSEHRPGDGLPPSMDSMREDFVMLFTLTNRLDATEPVTAEGRCFTSVAVPSPETRVAYQQLLEEGTGDIVSLAVNSSQLGPGLVHAPAAKIALELIHAYGSLGVSPELEVANGSVYLMRLTIGTVVLVRRRSWSDSGATEPFLELPPAVADAWRDQMREHGEWLWPVEESRSGATVTYNFLALSSSDLSTDVVYCTVRYSTSTRTAQVDDDWNEDYGPDGSHLDEDEIAHYAKTAW